MMNELLNKFIHQMTLGDVIWKTVDIIDSTSQQSQTSASLTGDKGHSLALRGPRHQEMGHWVERKGGNRIWLGQCGGMLEDV